MAHMVKKAIKRNNQIGIVTSVFILKKITIGKLGRKHPYITGQVSSKLFL
jgi:hypothetical protein